MTLAPFTSLTDDLVLGEVLGDQGPFDVTYKALHAKGDAAFVVREYAPVALVERASDGALRPFDDERAAIFESGRRYVRKEAHLLQQLTHPNLPIEVELFEANATLYRVGPFVAGVDVPERVATGGPLGLEEAVTLVSGLLEGVQQAHEAGLIHAGLSPSVLRLTEEGLLLPVKFRSAHVVLAQAYGGTDELVIPGYTPPEVAVQGGHVGPWTDVYGAAAVLHYLLTGEAPPKDPRMAARDASPSVRHVLASALAADPSARPQSAAAFRAALQQAARGSARSTEIASMLSASAAAFMDDDGPGGRGNVGSLDDLFAMEDVLEAPSEVAGPASAAASQLVAPPPVKDTIPRGRASARPPAAAPARAPKARQAAGIGGVLAVVAVIGAFVLQRPGADAAPTAAHYDRLVQAGDSLFAQAEYAAARDRYSEAVTRADGGDATYAHERLGQLEQLLEAEDLLAARQDELFERHVARADSLSRLLESLPDADADLAATMNAAAQEAYLRALIYRPEAEGVRAKLAALTEHAFSAGRAAQQAASEETEAERLYRTYREQGDQLLADGSYEGARRKYHEALEYIPDDAYAARQLEMLDALAAQTEAEDAYRQHMVEGDRALAADEFELAKRWYARALEARPDDAQALAQIEEADRRRSAAQAATAEAEERERQYQYHRGRGDALAAAGSHAEAIESYRRALEHRPEDPYTRAQLAVQDSIYANALAEEQRVDEDGVYTYLTEEEKPVLIGGLKELHAQVRYPAWALEKGVEGRVIVQVVVDEKGRAQEPVVLRGIGYGCDEEVLRALRKVRFEPGRVDGQPVKAKHALFVDFRLPDAE